MSLAMSNIAWPAHQDVMAYDLLQTKGVRGLEIAPTRIWPDLSVAHGPSAKALLSQLKGHGLTPIGFQALLFGRPDLDIFSPTSSEQCLAYLGRVLGLAASLDARALVFGSPKNRRRGTLGNDEAFELATCFFRALGDMAVARGLFVCLEPNPKEYGCDFICTVEEGARLVREVNSPGFKLHFDTGGMALNGEDAAAAIGQHIELAVSFHVSEPFLGGFAEPKADHARAASALRAANYTGTVSIEMKALDDNLASVAGAIDYVRRVYLK
jgi:sugar phosphate isomerase/epimerase